MPKSGVPSAFGNDSANIFYAIEFAFDSGFVRLWTGYGNISISGETYYGLGKCLSISKIDETSQMSVTGISVSVSGISGPDGGDSDLITDALSEPLQGRKVTCYIGTLDSSRVASQYIIFKGIVNTLVINDSGQTSTVMVTCESRLREFSKPRTLRYTDKEQQWLSPQGYDRLMNLKNADDTLEDVAALQNKKIDWKP